MDRLIFTEDHRAFRNLMRDFVASEIVPHLAKWEEAGVVDRAAWSAAGRHGILAPDVDEEYGGGGVRDYRYHVVRAEELARVGTLSPAFNLHSEVVGGYLDVLATPEQKRRWLPGFCAGDLIATIAVTEPEAGSDVAAIRTVARPDGDGYVLTGHKSFVTHGSVADLILVVALAPEGRPAAGRAPSASLLVVEPTMAGVRRGEPIAKIGLRSLDTVEIYLDEVRVPRANLLGRPGMAFPYLMQNLPRERLSIAVTALALAELVVAQTITYCRHRRAFGQPLGRLQHVRFELAEMTTALRVAREFTDRCIVEHDRGRLTAEEAAMVKWWNTELCNDATSRCLQLHGGYGYTADYLVGRLFIDARVQTIYGGTTEIMKEIIGQSLAL